MARKSVAGVPGSDPTLKPAVLEINGSKYLLIWDFNAIAEAEEKTGLDLLTALSFSHCNVRKYRALLFASLLKAHPQITLEEAGALVTPKQLDKITMALMEAWTGSRPDDAGEVKSEGNPPEEPNEN